MKYTLEQLMTIAYETTETGGTAKSTTSKNWAINQSKYTQTFKSTARPSNNRVPRPSKNGGRVVSDCAGFRELTVWVHFGDNRDWRGPKLSWLYQDNSMRCMGPSESGNEDNLDALNRCAKIIQGESKRIYDAETEWLRSHDTLDGLVIDGYYDGQNV